MALIGKWFLFWAAGVRLMLAAFRQLFQPEFTARQIFKIEGRRRLSARPRDRSDEFRASARSASHRSCAPDFIAPGAKAAAILPPGGGGRPSRDSARREGRVLQGGARAASASKAWTSRIFPKARNQRVPTPPTGPSESEGPRSFLRGAQHPTTPACGTRLRCCCRRGRGRRRRNSACGNGVSGQARHYPCPRRPSPPGGRHRPRRGFPP